MPSKSSSSSKSTTFSRPKTFSRPTTIPVYRPPPAATQPTPQPVPQQNIQIQQPTFGQSIKQGIGAGIGWSVGTSLFNTIFGSNKPATQVIHTETKVVEKVTTCENLRKMLQHTFDYQEREKLEKQIKENCPE